jgi:hypothetical protein
MKVKIIAWTPLTVCSDAIRTCWDSFDKSDYGRDKDKALINRVGNKYKHKSVLEHLRITFSTKNETLQNIFETNPYSVVTRKPFRRKAYITTNLRAIQEIEGLSKKIKKLILPYDYFYLCEELNNESI